MSIIAACGGGSGGAGGSGGTGGTGGTGGSTNSVLSLAAFFPADLFTATPAPLELTATPATTGAVTATIGAAGGTLTTTGPDGTVYTLVIPPDALALDIDITATPLKDVTGFPFDAQPANRLGVTFMPSGLQFTKTATLTIHPPALPANAGIAALSYTGTGHDAAAVAENIQPGSVTIAVDHFSGYVLTWPVDLPQWRQLAEQRIEDRQKAFDHAIEIFLEADRQKQLSGQSTAGDQTLTDFVLGLVKEYKEQVLVPALNAAALGCNEGQKAMNIWLGYWRQMQLLALDDDEAVAVDFNGATYRSANEMPELLLSTVFGHCMEELYQRCVSTGDFLQIPLYILGVDRQWQLLGKDIDQSMIDVATGYAKRCGHWRLDEDANFSTQLTPDLTAMARVTSSIDLEWKPGDATGIYAIIYSKIEAAQNTDNTGELVVKNFNVIATDQGGCSLVNDMPVQLRKATAKIKALQFEYPDDNGTPAWASTGYLQELKIAFDPGDVSFGVTVTCPHGAPQDLPMEVYQPVPLFLVNGFKPAPEESENTYLLDRAWTNPSTNPFRAEWEETMDLALTGNVGLKLFHMPQ